MSVEEIFAANGGLATTQQLLSVLTRKALAVRVKAGRLQRVRRGVYALTEPDVATKLRALDLAAGRPVVACLGTAAALYGFDTENTSRIHVLDPGVRMRPTAEVMVHQRVGAPLRRIGGRWATAPAWTAVEVARTLRRARALATMDAALAAGACTLDELQAAIREQRGRRGIVKVRELAPLADGRAESPMESETRLIFIDAGLPPEDLQHDIIDLHGRCWRVDLAWPSVKIAVEYDSIDWHMGPQALLHDRLKIARLQECGWTVIPVTVDDVRKAPHELVGRVATPLSRLRRAG